MDVAQTRGWVADPPSGRLGAAEPGVAELEAALAGQLITNGAAARQVASEQYLAKEVARISPPAEFMERGSLAFVGDPDQHLLRWLGERSYCGVVGRQLGGPRARHVWECFERDERCQLTVGHAVLKHVPIDAPCNRRAQAGKWLTSGRRLLNPRNKQGWRLLRAVADALHDPAADDGESRSPHEEARRLAGCWAW